jgi:hypothetical protein
MNHPYKNIQDYARWDRAIAKLEPAHVDPATGFPFRLTPDQPIVTAGSCFAQHISRHLEDRRFNFLVTEPGHPLLDEETAREFNYGVFSARYGNVYTSRQLEQLMRRAYGDLEPEDSIWPGRSAGFIDPFRPAIQPTGFATREELLADREQHFAAVRRAFEQLEVFVFTFGLTECWTAASDGVAFPLAPGVAGGSYDPDRYVLINLGVDEVVADMRTFIGELREVNPGAEVILTVSPVPLIATAVDRYVLVSTTYSKAVLRVAAQTLVDSLDGVHYFPSYEIVTGNFSRGAYFAEDLRSIREIGVEHVMSLFFKHATTGKGPHARSPRADGATYDAAHQFDRETEDLVQAVCDEELLALEQELGAGVREDDR